MCRAGRRPPRPLLAFLLLASEALGQDAGYCDGIAGGEARVVSSTEEAGDLAADLVLCPGLDFQVWLVGSTVLEEPLRLSNATTLRINATDDSAELDGDGSTTLFDVSEQSVLVVAGVGLTGGFGAEGGVVSAVQGSSVTFVDCDVYGNKAVNVGGNTGDGATGNGGAEVFPKPFQNLTSRIASLL